MSVRAKFKVEVVSRREHWDKDKGELISVKLAPVHGDGNPENEAFYAATPSGEIKMEMLNQAAGEQFELGAEYYIDFTRAD